MGKGGKGKFGEFWGCKVSALEGGRMVEGVETVFFLASRDVPSLRWSFLVLGVGGI